MAQNGSTTNGTAKNTVAKDPAPNNAAVVDHTPDDPEWEAEKRLPPRPSPAELAEQELREKRKPNWAPLRNGRALTKEQELADALAVVERYKEHVKEGGAHTVVGPAAMPPGTHYTEPPKAPSAVDHAAKILELNLKAKKLANGDVSYSLPTTGLRSTLADAIGVDREAFREVGLKSGMPHVAIIGQTDQQIAAAMEFTKHRWGNDPVVIHAPDEHVKRIIEHAVRANLNIDTSKDVRIRELVAKERERQKNPVLTSKDAEKAIAMLERAPSGLEMAR